jgi:hypothetical protein
LPFLRYSPTSRSRILLEKITVAQLVKELPTFYGTRRFITVFTTPAMPNIVVEYLAPLVRIREALGSNRGPETGYPELFRGFLQSLQEKAGIAH